MRKVQSDDAPWLMSEQRDSGHRHDAHIHPHVDEGLVEEHRGESDGQRLPELIAGRLGDPEAPPQENRIEYEETDDSHEADHTAGVREDEVRFAHFEQLQAALRPALETGAKDSTGADGVAGLDDVVAVAGRVLEGVERNQQARFLIVTHQEMPAGPGYGNDRQEQRSEIAPAHPVVTMIENQMTRKKRG